MLTFYTYCTVNVCVTVNSPPRTGPKLTVPGTRGDALAREAKSLGSSFVARTSFRCRSEVQFTATALRTGLHYMCIVSTLTHNHTRTHKSIWLHF